MRSFSILIVLILFSIQASAKPTHGIAMHGDVKYPKDFQHFDYVNPNAPQGGMITLSAQGSILTTNPFNARSGYAAPRLQGYVYETLMVRSHDEAFSMYGLIAESADLSEDRRSITFKIRKEAKWSDGQPLTVKDVAFSVDLFLKHGRPGLRNKIKLIDYQIKGNSIRFTQKSKTIDRELPITLGMLPVLPKHIINPETFKDVNLKLPIGSGPYFIEKLEPTKTLVYKKDPNYWGKNLPVNKGHYNFEYVKFEYFRDFNTMFESFKKGLSDIWFESDPYRWHNQFNFSLIQSGQIKKSTFRNKTPAGIKGLVLNTRRAPLNDIRVRKALNLAFNAEWINKNFYLSKMKRHQSIFSNSKFSSIGKPATPYELQLLKGTNINESILNGSFKQPNIDGHVHYDRPKLQKAYRLLLEAGFEVRNGIMTNKKTGKPLVIEFLSQSSSYTRTMLVYNELALKPIGVKINIRIVDSPQYKKRRDNFDFDMILWRFGGSYSPGVEQYKRWSPKSLKTPGYYSYAGANDPFADHLIDTLIAARSKKEFTLSVRALDRFLLSKEYIIPWFYTDKIWVAYKKQLQLPEVLSPYGVIVDHLWTTEVVQ